MNLDCGFHYDAESSSFHRCFLPRIVRNSHTEIRVEVPPGIGAGIVLSVVVANQEVTRTLSFVSPTIESLSIDSCVAKELDGTPNTLCEVAGVASPLECEQLNGTWVALIVPRVSGIDID